MGNHMRLFLFSQQGRGAEAKAGTKAPADSAVQTKAEREIIKAKGPHVMRGLFACWLEKANEQNNGNLAVNLIK